MVAQRKAAVATKITGRLVYLAVEEGSRVKKGDIIARLENEDTLAAKDQALASVQTARFQLEQSQAELIDATLSYNRSKDRSLLPDISPGPNLMRPMPGSNGPEPRPRQVKLRYHTVRPASRGLKSLWIMPTFGRLLTPLF